MGRRVGKRVLVACPFCETKMSVRRQSSTFGGPDARLTINTSIYVEILDNHETPVLRPCGGRVTAGFHKMFCKVGPRRSRPEREWKESFPYTPQVLQSESQRDFPASLHSPRGRSLAAASLRSADGRVARPHTSFPRELGLLGAGYNPTWRACANRSRPPL